MPALSGRIYSADLKNEKRRMNRKVCEFRRILPHQTKWLQFRPLFQLSFDQKSH